MQEFSLGVSMMQLGGRGDVPKIAQQGSVRAKSRSQELWYLLLDSQVPFGISQHQTLKK